MLLILAAAAVTPLRLPPIDQCGRDPGFARFRTELRRAIDHRDARALLPMIADDVYVSFGGYSGKADFSKFWGLERPASSKLWRELRTALDLGCAVEGDVRTSPSLEVQLDGDRDVFETVVALPGASLRSRPGERGRELARLKWEVMTVDSATEDGPWLAVKLDDGRKGFVQRSRVRRPIDYRASFRKIDGRWQMISFVIGD